MEDLDFRFMNKIQAINEMEKTVKSIVSKQAEMETALTEFQSDFQDSKDNLLEKITDNTMTLQKMASHTDRIAKLEEDLIDLENEMKKARQEGAIDYDALCSKKEYLEVMDLISSINSKDKEQDLRLDSDQTRFI